MSLENIFSIDCSTLDCGAGNLGAIENFDPNCAQKLIKSEIGHILLMHPTLGVAPTDWTVEGAGGWADVLDNTDSSDVKVKRIPCIGDKPAEERPEITGTNGVTFDGKGTYTLNITLIDIPDQLYDYMRKVQCGKILPIIWYEDNDGNMYGQNDGIVTTKFTPNFIHDRGQDSYVRIDITIQFIAQTDPDRITSPLPQV